MRTQRGKQSETFWPSMMLKKWLNIKPKLNDFSEDEVDTESEDDDGSDPGDDFFFMTHSNEYMFSESTGEKTMQRLQRRKSESLRVNYISNKDVRVMIGTWNVAGRTPSEDLHLDQWLCTQEPADMYVLGFQEVVPLSAGNVLGAEDSRPTRKWEAAIRHTLNKLPQQPNTICRSYSAPLSPASGNEHAYTECEPGDEVAAHPTLHLKQASTICELACNWLDWPEYPLDSPSYVLVSSARLRRVMSLGTSATNSKENPPGLQDVALQDGIRRQYRSSGNLGILWSEQQEKLDALNTLDPLSDWASEEGSPSVSKAEKCTNTAFGRRESSKPRANYVRIVSKQMVGIYVSIWVSRKLRRHVNNLEVAPVGVGLLGYMGNKGSISVSMSVFQTRFCFVCSHLASGHKSRDQQKRNSDVDEILQRTRFSSLFANGRPQKIPSHDRIFWFGDLNYRIDLPDAEVRRLVAMKRWDDLLKSDQITKELMSGSTFSGWKEGLIDFPPTYKYERNSSRFAGEVPNEAVQKRSPAWCDRILWFGKGTKQLSYWSSDLSLSDHRPVSSLFLVEVEVFDQRKLERVLNFTSPRVRFRGGDTT